MFASALRRITGACFVSLLATLLISHPSRAEPNLGDVPGYILWADGYTGAERSKALLDFIYGSTDCQDLVNVYWKVENRYQEITETMVKECQVEEVTKRIDHNEKYTRYLYCEMLFATAFAYDGFGEFEKAVGVGLDFLLPPTSIPGSAVEFAEELGKMMLKTAGSVAVAAGAAAEASSNMSRYHEKMKRADHFRKRWHAIQEQYREDVTRWKKRTYTLDCPPPKKREPVTTTAGKPPKDPVPPADPLPPDDPKPPKFKVVDGWIILEPDDDFGGNDPQPPAGDGEIKWSEVKINLDEFAAPPREEKPADKADDPIDPPQETETGLIRDPDRGGLEIYDPDLVHPDNPDNPGKLDTLPLGDTVVFDSPGDPGNIVVQMNGLPKDRVFQLVLDMDEEGAGEDGGADLDDDIIFRARPTLDNGILLLPGPAGSPDIARFCDGSPVVNAGIGQGPNPAVQNVVLEIDKDCLPGGRSPVGAWTEMELPGPFGDPVVKDRQWVFRDRGGPETIVITPYNNPLLPGVNGPPVTFRNAKFPYIDPTRFNPFAVVSNRREWLTGQVGDQPLWGCTGQPGSDLFRPNDQGGLDVPGGMPDAAGSYCNLTLLLGRPTGREAYPGDRFYLHSRLLERAAKFAPRGPSSIGSGPILKPDISVTGVSTWSVSDTPGTLSGGEKQRVGVAHALADAPKTIILDEPDAGPRAWPPGVVVFGGPTYNAVWLPDIGMGQRDVSDVDKPFVNQVGGEIGLEIRPDFLPGLKVDLSGVGGVGFGDETETTAVTGTPAFFGPDGVGGVGINAPGPLRTSIDIDSHSFGLKLGVGYEFVLSDRVTLTPRLGVDTAYGEIEIDQRYRNTFGGGAFEHTQDDKLRYYGVRPVLGADLGLQLGARWQLSFGGEVGVGWQHWRRKTDGCGDNSALAAGCDGVFYNSSNTVEEDFLDWSTVVQAGLSYYFLCSGGETTTLLGKCAALSMGIHAASGFAPKLDNPENFGEQTGLNAGSSFSVGGFLRLVVPLN